MEIDAEFPMVECFMALLFLHMGILIDDSQYWIIAEVLVLYFSILF